MVPDKTALPKDGAEEAMQIKQLAFGAIGAVAGALIVIAVLLPGSASQAEEGWSPALAKCVLSNLENTHTDRAATVLVRACRSLHD